jgi:hypothetical protein
MSATFFDLLKHAATGQASPSMTYYDKMRASMLMGGAVQTLTGQPPLTFKADGTPLISWSMKGNGSQSGTPTPDAPIMPEFVGKQVGADWTIQISCGGQTTPVYLGQTQTVRKIRKLVLDGTESNWTQQSASGGNVRFRLQVSNAVQADTAHVTSFCTHLALGAEGSTWSNNLVYTITLSYLYLRIDDYQTLADFKAFLAAQYAAGNPVTVWYVLAEPETAIVNEPLFKIGDYADELHSADAGVSIPTVKGQNTLTVDTDLQPSSMTITGNIKEV